MFEVEVEKLLNNGFGLARDPEGRVVFLPQSLPGERIRILQTAVRKGTQVAVSVERISQSEARQVPECPQFEACGGCDLLYVTPQAEADFKVTFLRDTLQRIGKITPPDVLLSDLPRSQSRFRGKLHLDRQGNCGFLARGSKRVVAFEPCTVVPPIVIEQGRALAKLLTQHRFHGEIWFLVSEAGDQVAFEWVHTTKFPRGLQQALTAYASDQVGVCVRKNRKQILFTAGVSQIPFNWNGFKVTLTPGQFMQANPAAWPLFWAEVDALQAQVQPQRIWDAHAGSGFLASRLGEVALFASEPDARGAAQLKKLPQVRKNIFHGTAEHYIEVAGDALAQVDAVILDPPRAGLMPALRAWLVAHGPPNVLYFSCDLATFARDLGALQAAYQLGPVCAFNMSPGTLKVESSVLLVRR